MKTRQSEKSGAQTGRKKKKTFRPFFLHDGVHLHFRVSPATNEGSGEPAFLFGQQMKDPPKAFDAWMHFLSEARPKRAGAVGSAREPQLLRGSRRREGKPCLESTRSGMGRGSSTEQKPGVDPWERIVAGRTLSIFPSKWPSEF